MSHQRFTNLEFTWHDEFWSFDSHKHVDSAEDEDGQDDGKVTDELPHLGDGTQTHLAVNRRLIIPASLIVFNFGFVCSQWWGRRGWS